MFRVLGNFLNTLFPFPGTTLFATRRRGWWEGRENRNSGRDLSSTAQGVIKSRLCFRLRPRIAFRLSGKKPHNAGNYCERSFFFFCQKSYFQKGRDFFRDGREMDEDVGCSCGWVISTVIILGNISTLLLFFRAQCKLGSNAFFLLPTGFFAAFLKVPFA